MYIFLAFACLIFFFFNVTFDKQGSKGIDHSIAIAIKGCICTLIMLVFVILNGNGHKLFVFSSFGLAAQVIVFGMFQVLNWIFYFKAIQKAKIDAFTSFNEVTFLFCANLMTLLFNFTNTVNGSSFLSLLVYLLGLASMAFGAFLIIKNKGLNEGVDKKWIFYDFIGCIFGSLYSVITPIVLSVENDLLIFYSMLIMTIAGVIMIASNVQGKDIKKVNARNLIFLALAGVFNIVTYLLRFRANEMDGANIAIINAVISSYFVIMTLFNAIIQKKKFPNVVWAVFGLMILGMVLGSVAIFIK